MWHLEILWLESLNISIMKAREGGGGGLICECIASRTLILRRAEAHFEDIRFK